jgi:hypothetical protein
VENSPSIGVTLLRKELSMAGSFFLKQSQLTVNYGIYLCDTSFSVDMGYKNLVNPLSDKLYLFTSCIHLLCQTSNTLNASTQNVVPKCKEFTSELILLSYNVVGFVLIAVCSKKTISHIETYQPT